jgi:putative peptidoglycan lipid II flippase
MALATLTSRVLGMVRVMVYANFMGDKWVAGAFTLAFSIPNLFRRLLGEGALTAAFIPAFTEKQKTAGEAEMWRAANAVLSGLIVVAATIIGLAMLVLSLVLAAHQFDAQTDLMLRLLRVMFPYMLLVCVAAVMMGMLNARGHFFIPAMGSTMLNLVMIASVIFLSPHMGSGKEQQIFALAIGVLVAGVAQAAFQLPALYRDGFKWRWVSPWRDEMVRRVVRKMIPGAIGIAAFQLNVLVTTNIAFLFDPQINASFDYAVRLMELPQGMFGISLATFLLPALSGLAFEKKYDEFRGTLRHGLETMLFANCIASSLLVVLASPIIRLLFERGEFTPGATGRAAFALICLAPGLVAFSTVNILARAFYALNDTRTPMRISIFCLMMNVPLSVFLVWRFKQGGLGMANSMTSVLNLFLLSHALRRKLQTLDMPLMRQRVVELVSVAAVAGAVAWVVLLGWEREVGHQTVLQKAGAVFVPAAVAGLVYLGFAFAIKVPAAREISGLLLRRVRR